MSSILGSRPEDWDLDMERLDGVLVNSVLG